MQHRTYHKNPHVKSSANFFGLALCKKLSRKITQNKESKMSDKAEVPNKSKTSDKLEKFLAGRDFILNCFIPEAIRNHRLDRFQDIDSTSFALYKMGQ
ncbi:unnamed protein product [Rhizophagus irregularis]|nr:unnamed protein product [Rhizophagus irregularis]